MLAWATSDTFFFLHAEILLAKSLLPSTTFLWVLWCRTDMEVALELLGIA